MVKSRSTDGRNVCFQRQFDHDSKIPCCASSSHSSRKDGDVVDYNLLQLLSRTEPHDLCFGRVQTESTGTHPAIDIINARRQSGGGSKCVGDGDTNIDLTVVCVLVQLHSVTLHDAFELSGVQYIQYWS